jgi:hypothetical protein
MYLFTPLSIITALGLLGMVSASCSVSAFHDLRKRQMSTGAYFINPSRGIS